MLTTQLVVSRGQGAAADGVQASVAALMRRSLVLLHVAVETVVLLLMLAERDKGRRPRRCCRLLLVGRGEGPGSRQAAAYAAAAARGASGDASAEPGREGWQVLRRLLLAMMLMLLLDVGCVFLQKGLGRVFGVSFRFGRGLVLGLVGGGGGPSAYPTCSSHHCG